MLYRPLTSITLVESGVFDPSDVPHIYQLTWFSLLTHETLLLVFSTVWYLDLIERLKIVITRVCQLVHSNQRTRSVQNERMSTDVDSFCRDWAKILLRDINKFYLLCPDRILRTLFPAPLLAETLKTREHNTLTAHSIHTKHTFYACSYVNY